MGSHWKPGVLTEHAVSPTDLIEFELVKVDIETRMVKDRED